MECPFKLNVNILFNSGYLCNHGAFFPLEYITHLAISCYTIVKLFLLSKFLIYYSKIACFRESYPPRQQQSPTYWSHPLNWIHLLEGSTRSSCKYFLKHRFQRYTLYIYICIFLKKQGFLTVLDM